MIAEGSWRTRGTRRIGSEVDAQVLAETDDEGRQHARNQSRFYVPDPKEETTRVGEEAGEAETVGVEEDVQPLIHPERARLIRDDQPQHQPKPRAEKRPKEPSQGQAQKVEERLIEAETRQAEARAWNQKQTQAQGQNDDVQPRKAEVPIEAENHPLSPSGLVGKKRKRKGKSCILPISSAL
jgi:hypothetical protein